MGKLKFKIAGVEYEYEGDLMEIIPFIQRVSGYLSSSQTRLASEAQLATATLSQSQLTKRGALDLPLPSDESVKRYILDKPDFRHTLFDVQAHFFGTKFKSRGESRRMYHRTAKQLRKIRKEIEEEHKGDFQEIFAEGGVKQFIFRKRADISVA